MNSTTAARKSVGIVREVYNKWERRAPLTPAHVQQLVQRGVDVFIQPSHSRIFTDEQYARAGARVTDDLSPANVIVGVKQVPIAELLPEKTYMFFSHTIKAQAENMELLDTVLQKKIMLIDYECITEEGERNGKRLIAFGGNAGRAGMLAGFRGVGERLINMGYSTPFVNVGSAYMYGDLERAKEAVEAAGRKIQADGLPRDLAPMTFVFTGNGNVSQGAQEIFKLMPHEMVHPSELPHIPRDTHKLYGTVVQDDYMVQPLDAAAQVHTRAHYYQHPHLYESVFHDKIAPHASMLVNCMYWDDRFPRLLTRAQLAALRASGNEKLLGIADISCDIHGSVEFLEYATEIERPFALYDTATNVMRDSLEGDGVLVMSVDILPSELAKESSQQFGDKLLSYVDVLAGTDARIALHAQQALPQELVGACIASNGVLSPKFQYIHRMRAEKERSRHTAYSAEKATLAGSTCVRLEGHLFDTGLINQVLNVIEAQGGAFHLVDCQVRPNFVDATSDSTSSAIVQISMDTRDALDAIITKIQALSELTAGANASVTELPDFCGLNYSKTRKEAAGRALSAAADAADENGSSTPPPSVSVTSMAKRKVVCLGAGLVAAPLVEYLSRDNKNDVHVVSGLENEATRLLRKVGRTNTRAHTVDVVRDAASLDALFRDASAVVSLLPAAMHTDVAQRCINHKTPLVTASYISPEMRALHAQAVDAGVPILCELGLDPGMDHMSAMKVIHEVQALGGNVTSFSSVCGGLPAPEAADNPIAYKFSWSPRGVLTAALNAAQYRKDGKVVNVRGEDLLQSNEACNFLPAFALEQIPNRDSLPYAEIYGIPDAETIYRGTLRYAGTCTILFQLRNLGLFDTNALASDAATWPALIMALTKRSGVTLNADAQQFLQWLGVFDAATPLAPSASVIDTFCALLMDKLAYQPGERDMAIMHHEFGVTYPDGKREVRTSTYVGYGSEQGDTVMAKTVGVTAAIGVQMILQDAVQSRGVLTPTTPDIYVPALARLEVEGVRFIEKTFPQL